MKFTVEDLHNIEEFIEMERLQRIKMQEKKEKIDKTTIKVLDYVIAGLILICVVALFGDLS